MAENNSVEPAEDTNNINIQLQARETNHNNTSILDDKTIRSSPSLDSEPPSYFEALHFEGFPQHINTLDINLNKESSFNLPPYPMNSSPPPLHHYNRNHNHQRHHYIRTENLPASIYCQNSSNSHRFQFHNTTNSNLKPSETYLFWSIFTTIYCVFIGVVALVLSIQVYHYNKKANYQRAHTKSKLCRNFNIAGLFFGIVYLTIGIVACLVPMPHY